MTELVDQGNTGYIAYLDLSKALDKIDHSLLLGKREQCGIGSSTTRRICIQHVVLNGITSVWKEACNGVPQGCISNTIQHLH